MFAFSAIHGSILCSRRAWLAVGTLLIFAWLPAYGQTPQADTSQSFLGRLRNSEGKGPIRQALRAGLDKLPRPGLLIRRRSNDTASQSQGGFLARLRAPRREGKGTSVNSPVAAPAPPQPVSAPAQAAPSAAANTPSR
jgi:hypothetical protein